MSQLSSILHYYSTEFQCPLTQTIMIEPMLSRYGTNFEKDAILRWLNEGNTTCPVTGKPLGPSCLVSNKNLKWKIQCWQGTNTGHATESEEGNVLIPDYVNGFLAFVVLPPKNFFCDFSGKIMSDPVVSKEGISFEREDILLWLEKEDICPVTGKALSPCLLIPNIKLRNEIQDWYISNDTFQSLAMDFGEDHQAAVLASKKLDSQGDEAFLEGMRRAQAPGKRTNAFAIKETIARSA
jgi:hypothetical protein